ncbi:MAG TPA: bifunctional isocitrate dehydrogenase kinase/phosphatase [Thermoanaerobaculia bacterium]|nr:bifunctional isocitrate dehydrogenase kinase/phosphatase [Thermoanaerobaculia bacterium]
MDLASTTPQILRGADTIHWAFDDHRQQVRAITRRVQQRFERRDWAGIRHDTVERLDLHSRSVGRVCEILRAQLGDHLSDRSVWAALKEAYTATILGRNDFELAQTFFNSLTRRVFSHDGVDPSIDFASDEFPLPYRGWEMASARMYAVRRVDAGVVRKILEDAGLRAPFRDLAGDSKLAAERIRQALREQTGGEEVEALDVLRPVFFRNKGAYVIGRARRGEQVLLPVLMPIVNSESGLELDAVLPTEEEASIVFSFARWYFHADVESPREVIGFLKSILPRKRIAELYISLGYTKHGKTELYRDLVRHIAASAESDEPFVVSEGQRGLVMAVFDLPSYPFVFKVIKDRFPPQKNTSRAKVMEKYSEVLLHDRVGRLVDFQDYEHLKIPKARISPGLLEDLLRDASRDVEVRGDDLVIRHVYVERRVTPLDVFLREAEPEEAEAAISDWGRCIKDLAAANIFPGDVLLKNFGVTRHGRVVFYDYDEVVRLTDCHFRPFPQARHDFEEISSETWFPVGESDVFPEELGRFLGLEGRRRELFLQEHGDLFGVEFWRRLQERHRSGEVVDFFPYRDERRLRPRQAARREPQEPRLVSMLP